MMRFVGLLLAFVAHAAVILFGGMVFGCEQQGSRVQQDVELLGDVDAEKPKDDAQKQPQEEMEQIDSQAESPPDAAEVIRSLESPPAEPPALDAASLGAIEQALNGGAGNGSFGDALTLASGGRIGGIGKAGALEGTMERAFSLAEIDQKPRAVFQSSPLFPSEMRGKKVEGVVTMMFVVDSAGRVTRQRSVSSSHPAFEKPALEALAQWKFEPAVKGGQRVACNMRVTVRFQQS